MLRRWHRGEYLWFRAPMPPTMYLIFGSCYFGGVGAEQREALAYTHLAAWNEEQLGTSS